MQTSPAPTEDPSRQSPPDPAAPATHPHSLRSEPRYIGFWARFFASAVDTVLFSLVLVPFILIFFGGDLLSMFLLELAKSIAALPAGLREQIAETYPGLIQRLNDPGLAEIPPHLNLWINIISGIIIAILILVFWKSRCATPGKMMIKAVIVDAGTLRPANNSQLLIRYLGYYVSAFLTLGIGFFMVGWTARKQGLHDFMAKTVVIHAGSLPSESAETVASP
jgi:uncharacterized RDD family membrane protein YckC